jgi:hypothetical protein
MLVTEENVVHLPEPALSPGCLGRFGRVLRVGMRLDQWKMAIDETQLLTHVAANSLNNGMSTSAVRALEVAVLHECYRSIAGAE